MAPQMEPRAQKMFSCAPLASLRRSDVRQQEILMRMRSLPLLIGVALVSSLSACGSGGEPSADVEKPAAANVATPATEAKESADAAEVASYLKAHRGDYVKVPLTSDLSTLDDKQKRMIRLLIQAARQMDAIYWQQGWGTRAALASHITQLGLDKADPLMRLANVNYGPWDRLNEDHPFVPGIGPRPAGGGFYPADMSKEQFEAADLKDKTGLYTLIRRDQDGKLSVEPYKDAYAEPLAKAATLLRQAAQLATNTDFADYLKLRADALQSDDFQPSDMAWMDMKDNQVDIVIGPIETYDDQLFGYKAAYEAYVLVNGDMAWSERLRAAATPAGTAAQPAGS
ncbi:MAG: hypothetical protein R3F12_06865 [Lysobacteraceae bacterium]